VRILPGVRFGRQIGLMGIEQMQPDKPAFFLFGQPGHGRSDHLGGPPLDVEEFPLAVRTVIVVVYVESLAQAETGVEGKAPTKAAVAQPPLARRCSARSESGLPGDSRYCR